MITRRRMLLLSVGGGALAIAGLAARSSKISVTRRGWALGTDVSMTVLADSRVQADRGLDAAFGELESVEQVMSLYRPESQLSRLNRDKVLTAPHPYLVQVLSAAQAMSRDSSGAFDITVQPLWDLYARCKHAGTEPSEEQIQAARRSIDWRGVEVESNLIRLRKPVELITLNGIAQGFAADRALAALRSAGLEHAMVNTGEIGSLGTKSHREPWTVGIQHPRDPEAFAEVIALDGRCLSTSGDYATAFTGDFSRNHIFDPKTGQSPLELASVSILAPTGLESDALSTAVMVLGPDRAMELVRSLPDVDVMLILKSGRTMKTDGFPSGVV